MFTHSSSVGFLFPFPAAATGECRPSRRSSFFPQSVCHPHPHFSGCRCKQITCSNQSKGHAWFIQGPPLGHPWVILGSPNPKGSRHARDFCAWRDGIPRAPASLSVFAPRRDGIPTPNRQRVAASKKHKRNGIPVAPSSSDFCSIGSDAGLRTSPRVPAINASKSL